jgi:hypothetical protein
MTSENTKTPKKKETSEFPTVANLQAKTNYPNSILPQSKSPSLKFTDNKNKKEMEKAKLQTSSFFHFKQSADNISHAIFIEVHNKRCSAEWNFQVVSNSISVCLKSCTSWP